MSIDSYILKKDVDPKTHIIAVYSVASKDLVRAAREIAIGQSIGNPEVRTERDSPEIFENNLAKIIEIDGPHYLTSSPSAPFGPTGTVKIAYPIINFGEGDGITQLMCTLMGGQMDIDNIQACRLMSVDFPDAYLAQFKGPKIGMDEIKRRTGAINRPLLGGIVKPKTGISVTQLEELVQELLDGGVDFIKEDEILGNPGFCSFEERIPRVADLVKNHEAREGRQIFYAPCINGDYPYFLKRAEYAAKHGLRAVHLNFWAGLSTYAALRDLELPDTALFFQKSGDKVLSSDKNAYGIEWNVLCQLARMSGVDFIHAGMWGGYSDYPKSELDKVINSLRGKNKFKRVVPSLSCGSHPGLVDTTVKNYGNDLMMNVGGAIQGHPMGTSAGARAMRQAMDKPLSEDINSYMQNKPELKVAIEKWGYVEP